MEAGTFRRTDCKCARRLRCESIFMVRVETIGGLSGHAGQDLPIKYATAVKSQVKKIFLVHGESKPATALMDKLKDAGLREIYYPELHSSAKI